MNEERWVPLFIKHKDKFLFKWNEDWNTYNLTGGLVKPGDENKIEKTVERKMRDETCLIYKEDFTFRPLSEKFRFIQYSLDQKKEQYFVCYPQHIIFLKNEEEINLLNKEKSCKDKKPLRWFSAEELSEAKKDKGERITDKVKVSRLKIKIEGEQVFIASALLDILWNITKEEDFTDDKELIKKGLSNIKESVNEILVKLRKENVYTGISSRSFRLLDKIKDALEDPFERPILITGEPGTGKSTIAKAIHELSVRKEGTFRSATLAGVGDVNFQCLIFGHTKGAFTDAKEEKEGLLETCNGGTVFLDEVTTLKPSAQEILLNTLGINFFRGFTRLEFFKYGSGAPKAVKSNVRIISATNEKPEYRDGEIYFEKLRTDLTARLAGHIIEMPDLKDLNEDLEHIIDSFLSGPASLEKYKDNFLILLGLDTEDDDVREKIDDIKIKFVMEDKCKKDFAEGRYPLKGNFRSLIKILADGAVMALKDEPKIKLEDIKKSKHFEKTIEIKRSHLQRSYEGEKRDE